MTFNIKIKVRKDVKSMLVKICFTDDEVLLLNTSSFRKVKNLGNIRYSDCINSKRIGFADGKVLFVDTDNLEEMKLAKDLCNLQYFECAV